MAYLIDELERIGETARRRLADIGIRTTGELLQACSTEGGRVEVALATGIGAEQLLAWVHIADLIRIQGVGLQYAELLGECGIDSLVALRCQRPEKLAVVVQRINRDKRLVKTTPSTTTIGRWVDDARLLPPKVFR